MTDNKSPLRYPGGKTRACKILDEITLEYYDIEKYKSIISPFFGGGSFEFYMQNKYGMKIFANDKFIPLYNFWNTCVYNKNELCNKLYEKVGKIEKGDFSDYRRDIIDEKNIMNQSMMYFIINRCSFSGATLSGGFSLEASRKRFTKSSIDRISKLDMKNFEIYNNDYEEFINNIIHNVHDGLIFLDPPYCLDAESSKLYGNNGDMHENFDHNRLYEYLSSKNNWIMTYNNCSKIKEMYSKYKIIETNWSYGMNKTKKSSEIVIIGK